MNYKWNYGNRVLVIPAEALEKEPSAQQLRVLLALAAEPELADRQEDLARVAGCTKKSVPDAIAFWEEAGILSAGIEAKNEQPAAVEAKPAQEAPKEAKTNGKLAHADELPDYTTAQMNEMMERRQSLRIMVNEAQKTMGKMLTPYEINILLGMVDYLGLDEDYILLLLAHCKRVEISGLRRIERYAISLMDSGVRTAGELEERVQTLEALHTLEGKVRAMFGMRNRSLTKKEQAMLEAWEGYGYGEDVIRRAYEIAVNSTGKPSMPYANSILERWHSEGLKTAEEIDRKMEEERASGAAKDPASSFNTDDFFAKALKRSFRTPESGESSDGASGGKD